MICGKTIIKEKTIALIIKIPLVKCKGLNVFCLLMIAIKVKSAIKNIAIIPISVAPGKCIILKTNEIIDVEYENPNRT